MRKAHIIKKPRSNTIPIAFICFDTETYDLPQQGKEIPSKLKLWTAVYHRRYAGTRPPQVIRTHGYTCLDLYNFIISRVNLSNNLHILSANIWFDLRHTSLINQLIANGWKIVKFFDRGRALLIKLRKDSTSISFVNIQAIIPFSVKKMGEVINLPKLDADFETISNDDLLTYCYRDTEIIYKMLLNWFKFITTYKLGSFKPTIASQAFCAFTSQFMNHKIYIHNWNKVIRLERAAYMGGRTEAYHIGKLTNTKLYIMDINSQYPYVMRENRYPTKVLDYMHKPLPKEIYELSSRYSIIAECNIITDLPVYPIKQNNKLIFPIGSFKPTLCTKSFQYAYEHGHIGSINKAVIYNNAPIFAKYVKTLYKLRCDFKSEKNTVYEQLIKLLLNSLYGKFGQRGDNILSEETTQDIKFFSNSEYDEQLAKWVMTTQLGNIKRTSIQMSEEGYNSFPAIAAHVTDNARMYLWKLCEKAKLENVYYMDTDSVFVNYEGYKNLKSKIHSTKLGCLKLECIADNVTIHGLKDYVLDGKVKLKGIPKSAKYLGNNTYEYLMFPSFKSDIQRGLSAIYTKHIMQKTLKRDYQKGIITPSGRVQPFVL